MEPYRIIVIGASAGGFEAIKRLVTDLPHDLPAALLVVWHMAPDVEGILPHVLNKVNTLHTTHAADGEAIAPGRIYVAPPDHHLLVERGRVRVTRGPKEHRFRPAVDPLFRSAAAAYGASVIGVVLSGALDDGSAGLRTIKKYGGIAVVQAPSDAEVSAMPENAMRVVAVDYAVPVAEMTALLVRLCHEPVVARPEGAMHEDKKTDIEIRIAGEENALEAGVMQLGELSPYTCPDCHGVLLVLQDGDLLRFRCHTGHAFSANSLLATLSATLEDQLWSAIRSIEEHVLLLNHLGDHFAEAKRTNLAALYYRKANSAKLQAQFVRQALAQHENMSNDSVEQEAATTPDRTPV